MKAQCKTVLSAYDLPLTLLGAVRYGQGHINDAYCVVCQPQEGDSIRYILQGLSTVAFPHPEQNLDRGRTQFKRVQDMEEQFDTMHAVVKNTSRNYSYEIL